MNLPTLPTWGERVGKTLAAILALVDISIHQALSDRPQVTARLSAGVGRQQHSYASTSLLSISGLIMCKRRSHFMRLL